MQSDIENAFLAYGYSTAENEEYPKTTELKSSLESKAEGLVAAGRLDEAMNIYITLAKIDPAEKAKINSVYFVSFMKNCSALKIGSTRWKYLGYESGKFVFVSDSILTTAPYENSIHFWRTTYTTTVSEWLSSAPGKYFNNNERTHVALWILSRDEVSRYMPDDSDRVCSGQSVEYKYELLPA